MTMETINDRMEMLVNERFGGNKAAFAKTIGLPPTGLSNYLGTKRRSKPSVDMVTKIITALGVDAKWLITGEEPTDASPSVENSNVCVVSDVSETVASGNDILLLPVSAVAGSLAEFSATVMPHDCETITVPIKGADMAIPVTGDSMTPEYPSGCIVVIKKINEKAFIEWGNVYVLDTVNGITLKRVLPCEGDENRVVCESLNPAYKPFSVAYSDIYGFYRVLMCLIRK